MMCKKWMVKKCRPVSHSGYGFACCTYHVNIHYGGTSYNIDSFTNRLHAIAIALNVSNRCKSDARQQHHPDLSVGRFPAFLTLIHGFPKFCHYRILTIPCVSRNWTGTRSAGYRATCTNLCMVYVTGNICNSRCGCTVSGPLKMFENRLHDFTITHFRIR